MNSRFSPNNYHINIGDTVLCNDGERRKIFFIGDYESFCLKDVFNHEYLSFKNDKGSFVDEVHDMRTMFAKTQELDFEALMMTVEYIGQKDSSHLSKSVLFHPEMVLFTPSCGEPHSVNEVYKLNGINDEIRYDHFFNLGKFFVSNFFEIMKNENVLLSGLKEKNHEIYRMVLDYDFGNRKDFRGNPIVFKTEMDFI